MFDEFIRYATKKSLDLSILLIKIVNNLIKPELK